MSQTDATAGLQILFNEHMALKEIEPHCNDILQVVYPLSIANAPMSPQDCRSIAEEVAEEVGKIRKLIAHEKGGG